MKREGGGGLSFLQLAELSCRQGDGQLASSALCAVEGKKNQMIKLVENGRIRIRKMNKNKKYE